MVDPERHPRDDDNHEARNVNGDDKEGQLPGKGEHHPETTVSTCNWNSKITLGKLKKFVGKVEAVQSTAFLIRKCNFLNEDH